MARRVHILGASGSGTTTLAQALAARLGCPHYDVDHYFWLPSDPPFQHIREREARCAMLGARLEKPGDWVLSGSLCGWGDVYIPLFDLVVFLWIPHDLRMARLAEREVARYGAAIEPGGAMHAGSAAFMKWAAGYDEGGLDPQPPHPQRLAGHSARTGAASRKRGHRGVESRGRAPRAAGRVTRRVRSASPRRQAAGGGATTSSYRWRLVMSPACWKTSSAVSKAGRVISTCGVQQPSFW